MGKTKCTELNHDWEHIIRMGRANWVCPRCNKNVMLLLVLLYEAGVNIDDLKGIKNERK